MKIDQHGKFVSVQSEEFSALSALSAFSAEAAGAALLARSELSAESAAANHNTREDKFFMSGVIFGIVVTLLIVLICVVSL